MIEKILSRPVTIVMCAVAVIIIGVISFVNLPIELMPSTRTGEISIIYQIRGGIPPDRIEEFVVRPVEDVVGDLDGLNDILAISKEGRAIIVLMFKGGTNMDAASINVRERLAQVRDELPREVERPIIANYQEDDLPIFVIGVTSPERTAEEIRRIVDETVEHRLERLKGVGNVDVFGGRERKIMIEIDPFRMMSFNLSVSDIINTLNRANVSMLAGEAHERESRGYQITATGRFESIEDIENLGIALSEAGSIIRMQDVATVKEDYLERDSLSRFNLQDNVTVYIQKETLARTVEVANLISEEMDSLRASLPDDIMMTVVKNDAEYITNALDSMKVALVLGAFLAAGILVFFLKNYTLILIIFLAIPVSVLLAISLLYFNRVHFNVMTIGGLALGVGMLLDNSIVVIENMSRVYREKQNIRKAVAQAASEVVLPIVAGTFTTIVVFLPIIFVSDAVRRLQGDMALAIMFSLLASLFASLTLVPFLYLNLCAKKPGRERSVKKMHGFYSSFMNRLLKYRLYFIGGLLILFGASIIVFNTIDMNLFESEDENQFTVHVELPTGARLHSSDERVIRVENLLKDFPEVKTVTTRIEKWSSNLYVTLKPADQRDKTKEQIKSELRPRFEQISQAFIYFQEPHAMAEQEIFVELFGYDYGTMKELAQEIGGRMRGIDGLDDVKLRMREGRPEKVVIPDRHKAAIVGLSISDIARNLHARLRGMVATRFHEGAEEIEVIVRQHRPTIMNFDQLFRLNLMIPAKEYVQLNQLAEFVEGEAPSEIWRKNRQRMVQVSATRSNLSLERAAELTRKTLAEMEFPENYFYDFGGDYEFMLESRRELLGALVLTIILVYLVLGSVFESYLQPFIIMVAVPMSFIGVVVALLVTKSLVSMGVIMGMIMLAGIVVNNSIMLVDRVNYFRQTMPIRKAVIEGAIQRIRPILMTSATTIFGLLPLALQGGEGSALWRPLSVVVVGGLAVSTFLVLIGVPCIYLLIEDAAVIMKKLRKLTMESL